MSALLSESVGRNRAADIYAAIYDAVVDHRLPPGAKLPEEQIGALFSASRTLVRTAFQALAHDHIVTIERNRGAFVSAPTVADAHDIFVSRRILESGVAREAAAKFDASHTLRLRALLREEAEALRKGDRQAAIQLSGTFHLTIAATLGAGALTRFLRGLISRSSLVIALYGRGPASACGHAEHGALADALAARDGERAAELMREHLDHIVEDLALVPRADEPTDVVAVLRGAAARRGR